MGLILDSQTQSSGGSSILHRAPSCPICLRPVASSILEKFHHYKLFACEGCGLQFWEPRRMPDGHWYEQMYGGRDTTLLPLEPGHRYFLNDPHAPRSGTLLDVGCGTGNFLLAAHRSGYSVIGTELDPKAARFARESVGLPRILSLDLEQFVRQHPGERFDVVTFFEVLEHQSDPSAFLRYAKSCCRPRGYVALSVPNRRRWSAALEPLDYPPNHFLRWDPSSLRFALESFGFDVLSMIEQPATLRYTAYMVNSSLRTGLSRKIAPDLPPSFDEITQHPADNSPVFPESPSRRVKLFEALSRFKAYACFPLALLLMPYVRLRGYKTGYLYCLARRRD